VLVLLGGAGSGDGDVGVDMGERNACTDRERRARERPAEWSWGKW